MSFPVSETEDLSESFFLAINTSQDTGSCLVVGSKGFFTETLFESKKASTFLFQNLDRIFQGKSIAAVVIGIGPGSFTGTRIGSVAGQFLAFGWKVPLMAIRSEIFLNRDGLIQEMIRKWEKKEFCHELDLVYISNTL